MRQNKRWLFSVDLYPHGQESIPLRGCTEVQEINLPGGGLRITCSDGQRIVTTLPYLYYEYTEVSVEAK